MVSARTPDDEPNPSRTLRHPPRERPWEPAVTGDADTADAIDRHITRHFGPISWVWHELVSDLVHVDVHVVEPSQTRPYFTLVTSGMSDRPMTVPGEADSNPYAELILCLPADWPMSQEAFANESAYWPIRVLKMVARLPHEYATWIAEWHTIPNGDPAVPYADGTPFVCVLVAPMLLCEADARSILTDAGKRISLLALVPLHPAEMELKLSRGTDALLDAFDRVAVNELFDPARPSSV